MIPDGNPDLHKEMKITGNDKYVEHVIKNIFNLFKKNYLKQTQQQCAGGFIKDVRVKHMIVIAQKEGKTEV